jgi:hypothetical protein
MEAKHTNWSLGYASVLLLPAIFIHKQGLSVMVVNTAI